MRKILLIALALAFTPPCFAQTPGTGFPMYGSFDSSPADTVNRNNFNSVLIMPIVSGNGRGLGFNYSVSYNSLVWTLGAPPPFGSTWQPNFYGSGGSGPLPWGWNTKLVTGGVTYNATVTTCGHPRMTTYNGFLWVAPDGTQRSFPITTVNVGLCGGTSVPSGDAAAADGSGYHMWVTNYTTATVFAPDGSQVNPILKDTNGNFVSSTVNGAETDWTDSAGHIILKIVVGASSILYEVAAPDGSYQTTTLNLTSYNIKTNFGCFGITENTTTAKLPSSLVYPNGQQYTFTYEPTPGNTGYVTGRIQKATLPNGGYVQYTFGTTNDGISCGDGTIVNVTRIINDAGIWGDTSTWTFVRTAFGTARTVTYPQMPYDTAANQSVYTINSSGQETQAKIYQGSTSGTLLRTINTTWAANGSPATKTTILEDNSTQSEIETNYDSNGNLLSLKEHDFGTGAPGSILRTTTDTYLSTTAYTNLNIVNRVTRQTIADSTGTLHFRQDTTYDGTTISPCPTGAAQHDDTNYGCSFTTRGNPTSVTKYTNASVPSGPITLNSYYDIFGNLVKADINCCQSKVWTFSATTQYAYPDSDTCGATGGPQVTTSYTYNTHTGQMASMTDPNNQLWSYAYDTMRRPTTTTRPDNAQLSTSYQDSQNQFTQTNPTQGTNFKSNVVGLDGIARKTTTNVVDNSNNIYSKSQRQLDPLGRRYKASNPYTGSSPQYWTTIQYDALGRETKKTWQDSSQSSWIYSTNSVTLTDPAGHQIKSQTNGLEQLSAIFEPDPTTNNSLTLQTNFSHTVLGKVSSLTEGSQTRTYTYDDAGRMTSMATPESGTTSYQFNNFNKVIQRTDARGVMTTYTYDTMNRPYQTSYNVGTTGVAATAQVTTSYGTSATQLNNGRLLSVTDGVGSETYAYDNLGRITQEQQIINGNTYTIGYQYNLDGTVSSTTYPSGRIIQQGYDAIGRTNSLSSGSTTYASNFTYLPLSRATGWSYGNGAAVSIGYSSDRLQWQSQSFTKGSTTLFSTSYGFTQNGGNNGQITSSTDSFDSGRSAAYSYDALNRLTSALTTGSTNYPKWGLSFTYDRYGNRTAQTVTSGTAPSNSVTVSATTNHITTSGYTYDLSGDLTNDGNNALTYDGEGQLITAADGSGTATYSYNSSGLRAVKSFAGTSTVYVFSHGHVIAEYAGGSLSKEYVTLGGRRLASYVGGTLYYHGFDNHSMRLTMDASGNKVGEQGHFPFGEDWYMTNTTSAQHFTNYERDSESGNDYAIHRFYVNRLARFSSPDPVPGGAQGPQSLDLYSYVANDPWNRADPSGQDIILPPPGSGDPGCIDPMADCASCNPSVDISCPPSPCTEGGTCERIEQPPPVDPPPSPAPLPTPPCISGQRCSTPCGNMLPVLCNAGDTFSERWICPAGCNLSTCASGQADYTIECLNRGKPCATCTGFSAICSTFHGYGAIAYCDCCKLAPRH
jgi:RHS repeat-associated protein